MLFSSLNFIGIFLPILLLCFVLAPRKYKMAVLLAGSFIFYGIGEPSFVVLLIGSLVINYFLGEWMGRMEKRSPLLLSAILIWNFGLLFFFKYFDFFAQNVNAIIGHTTIPLLHLMLPLGISFYTFQIVSYQIDIYKGVQKKRANLFEFCLYVCMFPQLVAGPIVQYNEVEEAIKKPVVSMSNIENGLKIFTIGLGLKVLLANQISTLFNNIQGIGAPNIDASIAWLGAFAYSFQLYFDFWGYSMMAIGLGQLFGFQLPINFNNPYVSRSATEFWRRWHITLSRWFRDYVYIPLGGNRKGRIRTSFNLLIVWSLTGLWHGASWNFVIWGLFFFVLLTIEKAGLGNFLQKYKLIGHLYCIIIIPVSWIIFAQTDITTLGAYLKAMFGGNSGHAMVGMVQLSRYLKEYWILLAACFIFSTPAPMRLFKRFQKSIVMILILFAIFWYSVYQIHQGANNPFLYFRF